MSSIERALKLNICDRTFQRIGHLQGNRTRMYSLLLESGGYVSITRLQSKTMKHLVHLEAPKEAAAVHRLTTGGIPVN